MNNNVLKSATNLDEIVEQFKSWEKYVSEISKNNVYMQDEVSNLKKLILSGKEQQTQVQHDLQVQGNLVETLQGTLGKRCDLEDENRSLKEEILILQEVISTKSKENEQTIADLEKTFDVQSADHIKEIKKIEEKLTKHAEAENYKYENTIAKKSSEIQALQKDRVDMENKHQAQLVQIRLDCDSKLLKLQKQNSKAQHTSSSTVNQDIFRKKYQHAKAEYEKEISNLKKTVGDLKQKISFIEQKSASSYSHNSGSSLQSKKRRY